MNRSLLKVFRSAADDAGLLLDENSGTMYGNKSGYNVCINQVPDLKAFYITISVKRMDQMPEHSDMNEIVSANKKLLNRCEVTRYKVRFQSQLGAGINFKNALAKVMDALQAITSELLQRGFENACQACGTSEGAESYFIGSAPAHMCSSCYHDYCESSEATRLAEKGKKENLIGGIAGAFLGSLLGGACIVLLGQLGYVASLSGLVMGVCALKGYELLGGKLSKKGIVVSSLLMVVLVYVSQRADYAITVANVFEADVISAFRAIPALIQKEVIEAPSYYTNLGMLYLFTAVGAVPTIINVLKNKKQANIIYRLGA
ncbi:hypothetical protein HNQ56_001013 [Anaerotaenia torta]|uniref:hypothetical protein n=1 Tax=Anaerotaenia torta TaxID=433293 RepID=UPI003D1AEB64